LLFMYQQVLGRDLEFMAGFDRAQRRQRVPVVLSREEVQRAGSPLPAVSSNGGRPQGLARTE